MCQHRKPITLFPLRRLTAIHSRKKNSPKHNAKRKNLKQHRRADGQVLLLPRHGQCCQRESPIVERQLERVVIGFPEQVRLDQSNLHFFVVEMSCHLLRKEGKR